ncbi:MAG: prolyl oligopeptidase family serine peptidase [Gemmatimonadaceae bacterium]
MKAVFVALCLGASSPALVVASPLHAQQQNGELDALRERLTKETYVTPPAEIARLVTAPRHLNVTLSEPGPDRRRLLKVVSGGLAPVTVFGKRWHNLAGLQIDPRANRARTLTTRGSAGLEIVDALTGRATAVDVPQGATLSNPQWSPDGSQVSFLANYEDATYLYVADAATGRSRRVAPTPVLATLVTSVGWTADGRSIVTVLPPEGRGPEPSAPPVATGPQVRVTTPGAKNKTRTYADLLEGPYDQALLEYYATGQLAVVDVAGGARGVRRLGRPAMIQAVDPSPDGRYFRVTLLRKPFSYFVPVSAFGTVDELWDASGTKVAEVARRALRESDSDQGATNTPGPNAANDTARRSIGWMPNGQGLYYLQQEPAPRRGDADTAADTSDAPAGQGARARRKDRLYHWLPPFDTTSRKVLLESNNRIAEVLFAEDARSVFVAENANGLAHVYAVYFDEPSKRYTLTRVRGLTASLGRAGGGFGGGGGGARGGTGADSVTFYQNPGTLMSKRGRAVPEVALLSSDGRHAYLRGIQYYRTYNDSAPRPFVDRIEVKTGEKQRIFEAAADVYEEVEAALDDDFAQAVVTRESATTVPDSYLRDMKTGRLVKLTSNRDYSPEITTAPRRMIQVTRADGYRFWVNVTLPPGYRAGTRLPGMFWFYPYEFTDQPSYDRSKRTYNRNRFPQLGPRSMVYLVTRGYAVIEPDVPIVGAPNRMNDNYVSDLRNNLAAVIDELDRQGIVDRQRLGLGGHSYGAFGTVNAMVHTPFFKAGIAGDGNYNRTLTPNSFQSERRDLWEARETYLAMSPILYADRLTGALLLYHGLADQNVGTDPINSVRLFHALQGMGKTVALYNYPYEDHGPATRETLLDLWGRWTAWLDLYVKNAGRTGRQPEKVALTP